MCVLNVTHPSAIMVLLVCVTTVYFTIQGVAETTKLGTLVNCAWRFVRNRVTAPKKCLKSAVPFRHTNLVVLGCISVVPEPF